MNILRAPVFRSYGQDAAILTLMGITTTFIAARLFVQEKVLNPLQSTSMKLRCVAAIISAENPQSIWGLNGQLKADRLPTRRGFRKPDFSGTRQHRLGEPESFLSPGLFFCGCQSKGTVRIN